MLAVAAVAMVVTTLGVFVVPGVAEFATPGPPGRGRLQPEPVRPAP